MFRRKQVAPISPTPRPPVSVRATSKVYADPELAKYTKGVVVMEKDGLRGLIGHVSGFSLNVGEIPQVILVVDWCDGSTRPIHHKNVILFGEQNDD